MHHSSQSVTNLQPPLQATAGQKQQRRMTSPSLNPPENPRPHSQGRPPSPLRNGFVPNTSTGIDPNDIDDDDEDDDERYMDDEERERARLWAVQRSPSPALSTSSVSHMAASFAQRVGSFVSEAMTPRSPGPGGSESMSMSTGHLTDAELEAEAERERDRSRKEAERILMMEARERKLVEDRVLAMMDSTRALPPPPSRSQTMPASVSSSPSGSHREGTNWWTAAKNKLTPTKDKDLTPAQQVVQDVKKQDKERDKEAKKIGKGKEKANDWPANPNAKFSDPSLLNLNLNANVPTTPPRRPYAASNSQGGSPNSPTPSRTPPRPTNLSAPNLSPSYSNSNVRGSPAGAGVGASPKASLLSGSGISGSPSKEAPPLYATFSSAGVLDIPVTLITIAKRFEKLEKWTVGHVRALEERMGDVERWLVDKEKEKEEKEKEKEKERGSGMKVEDGHGEGEGRRAGKGADNAHANEEIQSLRDEIMELQGRITELGREMARMAVEPTRLSHPKQPRGMSGDSYDSLDRDSIGTRPSYELINGRRETSHAAIIEGLDEPTHQSEPAETKPEAEASPENSSPMDETNATSMLPSQPSYPSTMRSPTGLSRIPSLGAGNSTSPPMARVSRQSTGSRLPYPTGDYTSGDPNGMGSGISGLNSIMASGSFSPGNSPPSSVSKTSKGRPMSTSYSVASLGTVSGFGSIPGLSNATNGVNANNSPASATPAATATTNDSPSATAAGAKGSRNLPLPPSNSNLSNSSSTSTSRGPRQQSDSPSPAPGTTKERKRYTVALGGPLTAPDDWDNQQHAKREREAIAADGSIGRAFFSASPSSIGPTGSSNESDGANGDDDDDDEDDEDDEFAEETIGKSASARIIAGGKLSRSNAIKDRSDSTSPKSSVTSRSLPSSPSTRDRVRPHSTIGHSTTGGAVLGSSLTSSMSFPVGDYRAASSTSPSPGQGSRSRGHMPKAQSISVAPLRPRSRTQSSQSLTDDGGGPKTGKFVDPLILRKQEQEARPKIAMPKPVGKVPIGQLVAFFDGDRK
ncbi:hypothetical protein D9758_005175 [Tetrapyrgos nigripes]|uniref:Uncharacterized protein n=1 Tax=Tetrapyrgos nigripes TaxID=182062 RepID=A0A8H5GX02_9AGAR|nr:hypothetical protein D9758_005175 [Tetrapyrgos nigripes]